MKKTKYLILFILVLIIITVSFSSCGSNKTSDTKLNYEIANNEATITGYKDSTLRTEIAVPDEIEGVPVTKIADFSLFNAESLQTIYIGKNVKEIGTWSMTNNQGLKQFVVDEQNQYFCSVDGVLFSKDMTTLIYYPPAKNIEFNKYGEAQNKAQYDIPAGVETIRSKAFYKCYYVEHITMPDTVTSIEEKAFHRTSALENFNLSQSIEFIGKDAFSYDEKLTSMTISSTIKQIDEYAFFNCTGMTEVVVNAKEENIILGKKWQPTEKGKIKDDCQVTFS